MVTGSKWRAFVPDVEKSAYRSNRWEVQDQIKLTSMESNTINHSLDRLNSFGKSIKIQNSELPQVDLKKCFD